MGFGVWFDSGSVQGRFWVVSGFGFWGLGWFRFRVVVCLSHVVFVLACYLGDFRGFVCGGYWCAMFGLLVLFWGYSCGRIGLLQLLGGFWGIVLVLYLSVFGFFLV